jgi:hypothetical protein
MLKNVADVVAYMLDISIVPLSAYKQIAGYNAAIKEGSTSAPKSRDETSDTTGDATITERLTTKTMIILNACTKRFTHQNLFENQKEKFIIW